MTNVHLFGDLFDHPVLVMAIIIWIVLVLHLPYRYEHRRDRQGRTYKVWQSLLYHYSYGPNYERLNYYGMRRLQNVLIELLCAIWKALHKAFWQRILDELRRRLEL